MPRKCRYCKEYNIPKDAPKTDAFCSHEHKVAYAMDVVNRSRQKQAKLVKQECNRQKKERLADSLPHQKEITRIVFNKMIRLLDQGLGCISCGKYQCGRRMEAGHFKSVGSHPELRYEALNCHLQGSGCNSAGSDRKRNNLTVSKEYEIRLRIKIGDDAVNWLNGPHPAKHYTCADLVELRKEFNAEIRRLEKGLPPSRNWREIPQVEQMRGAA